MKKLGMLLVVIAICCLPAYGYILVYKATLSGTSAVFNTDPNGWVLGAAPATAYLVLDVNDDDPNVLTNVEYIDYFTVRSGHVTSKLYDIFTADDAFSQTILSGQPPRGKNITALSIALSNGGSSTQLTGLLLGNNASTDIGLLDPNDNLPLSARKIKVNVATNPKGFCRYISGTDLGDPNEIITEQGCGTFMTTMDTKWTKIANDPGAKGFDANFDNFVNPDSNSPQGLLNWLRTTGKYTPVAP
jgi:hypothetical protein